MKRTQMISVKGMIRRWPAFRWRSRLFFGFSLLMMLTFPASSQQTDGLIRRSGKHIRLTTDLPDTERLDRWISTFDAAVPLWSKFWAFPSGTLDDWTIDACVMQDTSSFKRLGLIDPRVPEFPFAYALRNKVWVRVQPSNFYTEHLLLHEGVHSLAFEVFGDTGPTWFREGIAELLATHRGNGPDVRIGQVPKSREASPFWGRFKRMAQLRSELKVPRIESVLEYETNLRGDVDAYAWSWTLASMLNAYPQYRKTLLQAAQHGHDTDRQFNQWLIQRLADDWEVVQARWRVLVQDFDYGYDWDRQEIAISKADPMWDGQAIEMKVSANRGWQSIGVRLNRGMALSISAHGAIIVDDDPKPWVSHADGVTLEYHQGQPLGKLQARMVPNIAPREGTLPPLETIGIGKQATIQASEPCWLLLRVNDAPGSLDDNESSYNIKITRAMKPPR